MSAAADHVVAAVVERLDREALVDEIFAIYVDRFESYASLPADLLAGPIRDGGLANVDLVLALLADDRDAIDECRVAAQAALQGRFAAGVTAEDSLKSLRIAADRIWQAAVAAASPESCPRSSARRVGSCLPVRDRKRRWEPRPSGRQLTAARRATLPRPA